MKIIIGTRGSKLAMVQTHMVRDSLIKKGMDVELNKIKTSGDIFLEKSLKEFGGKGAFVSEINDMIVRGEIDAAVHSMKDVPTALPTDVEIAAVLPRASRKDVLVSNYKLTDLPEGATVGTSSVRRKAQLLKIRPDLLISDIRGNIDTRIRKLKDYDAIIMAKAGLDRLNIKIDIEELPFITSAGQGAIAVASKKGSKADEVIRDLDHRKTRIETEIEREILGGLGGGCVVPMGVAAEVLEDQIDVKVEILSLDGKRQVNVERSVKDVKNMDQNCRDVALNIVEELKRKGGVDLIEEAIKSW